MAIVGAVVIVVHIVIATTVMTGVIAIIIRTVVARVVIVVVVVVVQKADTVRMELAQVQRVETHHGNVIQIIDGRNHVGVCLIRGII